MPLLRTRRTLLPLLLTCAAAPARALLCSLEDGPAVHRIVACRPGVSFEACRRRVDAAGCAVVRELPLINAVVVALPAEKTEPEEARLRIMAEVLRVDPDPRRNWLKSVSSPPRDFALPSPSEVAPRFAPSPTAASDPEQPWGVLRVNAAAAWPRAATPAGVAVIDTGIDGTHPDLRGQVAGGYNALDPAQPSAWRDEEGHGTHVAGIIAAKRDNRGVVGVAPQAFLYAVRVLDAQGNGSVSEVIAGIQWAAQKRIPVANMSLGSEEGHPALEEAVKAAYAAGTLIVAAAGNSEGGTVNYPAAYEEALAVSASKRGDGWAEFSSVGLAVDLIAPGDEINSAKLGGGYVEYSGTSMAAPHVSGLAALLVSMRREGPASLRQGLLSAARPLPGLTRSQQGSGLPDASLLRP